MRLFVTKSIFVSVIKDGNAYSCQLMELMPGMGMYSAGLDAEDEDDVISIIMHVPDCSISTNVKFTTLEGVFKYHKRWMKVLG